jgi:hypothetical protein
MRFREAANSARLSVFAIAVATSSLNRSSRSPASSGSGSTLDATVTAPQRRPSRMIGLATLEATRNRLTASASAGPNDARSRASNRADCPVR